jgi:hypothetical protein
MEQQPLAFAYQQQAVTLAAQQLTAGTAQAVVNAQIAAGAAQTATTTPGAQMEFSQDGYELDRMEVPHVANALALPIVHLNRRKFGTALSTIVTLTLERCVSGGPVLWWSLLTSLDGSAWTMVYSPGESGWWFTDGARGSVARFHGPFGNEVGVRVGAKEQNATLATSWVAGTFEAIKIQAGTQHF